MSRRWQATNSTAETAAHPNSDKEPDLTANQRGDAGKGSPAGPRQRQSGHGERQTKSPQ